MDRMTLEALNNEWQNDSKIDSTEPGKELLRNPNLHSKYAEQLMRHSLALKGQRLAYNALRRLRSDYYNGRMTQADLEKNGLQQFPLVLKSDIGLYLDADPALQALEQKIAIHEEAITLCGSILKTINNRSFDLRGYIDWIKYTQGNV
jgi:hypothetical protein